MKIPGISELVDMTKEMARAISNMERLLVEIRDLLKEQSK